MTDDCRISTMIGLHFVLSFIVMNFICHTGRGQNPPAIVNSTDTSIVVGEDTPVGTVIRTLQAKDDDNDSILIQFQDSGIETKTLVMINQTEYKPGFSSADLILKSQLDRDFNPFDRILQFKLEDNSTLKLTTPVTIHLIITDVNDEPPRFQDLPYRLDLQEDRPNHTCVDTNGTVVYRNIVAKDPDKGIGGIITFRMEPITQSSKDAALFADTFSIDKGNAEILKKRCIDYEEIQFYQFNITALDGYGLNSSTVLTITILDIQDTAPEFQGIPYVVTITENVSVGFHFFTSRAIDGDRGIPNSLTFNFTSGHCLPSFKIDHQTGEITVAESVDRDSGDIMTNSGVCDLTILVSEIEGVNPQYGATTSTTTIIINVLDVNDNKPYFSQNLYKAYIADTAVLNYPVQIENYTEIVIRDQDQGANGVLELLLRSQDGDINYDFQPIPNVVTSHSAILLVLKSQSVLQLRENITLEIYATERYTTDKYSATASIVIFLLHLATTTIPTTSTTPKHIDVFTPSVIGAVIGAVLLLWAISVTWCYCFKYNRMTTANKVNHRGIVNSVTNGSSQDNRNGIVGTNES